jgi:hypothetical protein
MLIRSRRVPMEGGLNLCPSLRGNIRISTLYEKGSKVPRMIVEEAVFVGAYPMMQSYGVPEEQESPSNEIGMILITPHFLSQTDLKGFEFLVWFHNGMVSEAGLEPTTSAVY